MANKPRPKANPFLAATYKRGAGQRLEDAEVLLRAGRTTGAMHLAGYAVECMLKALILAATVRGRQQEVLESFYGNVAHNLESLKARYVSVSGEQLSREIARKFLKVNTWSTSQRYEPGRKSPESARAFFETVQAIVDWGNAKVRQ